MLRARFERRARGLSANEAAFRAGISVRDVDDVEDNRRPDPAALRALAAIYGYPPENASLLLREVPAEIPDPPDLASRIREARRR